MRLRGLLPVLFIAAPTALMLLPSCTNDGTGADGTDATEEAWQRRHRDGGAGRDAARPPPPPPPDAGGSSDAGPPPSADSGVVVGKAGNPHGSCKAGVPAGGQPADTSKPTTVVGTGTAASCTFAALSAAVSKGGVITFNCGGAVTIPVTATMNLPTTTDTVIDGGGNVTLDGGHAVRIMSWNSANSRANEHRLTLQHITIVNGKAAATQAIPPAPAPCSQGWNAGQGGALFMRDGNLTVIDSIFANNQGAQLGPDTGGGAIYMLQSKHGALIVSSTFQNNSAANAGAVGGLFSELDVYNSLFTGNVATGHGANSDDASKCPSAINNGQHEVGSGGNGGALYSDGNSVNVTLCGDEIVDNHAAADAFGGGLFFTSNDMNGSRPGHRIVGVEVVAERVRRAAWARVSGWRGRCVEGALLAIPSRARDDGWVEGEVGWGLTVARIAIADHQNVT